MVCIKLSTLKKLSIVLAFFFFSFLINPISINAQTSDLPTWSSKQMQIPADYQPREIKDIFAEGAVHYEDLAALAKFMPYVKDEIVVAIQHKMDPSLARKYFSEVQWNKYLQGLNVSFINVLFTNNAAGKTVSLVHLKILSGTDPMQAIEKIEFDNTLLWASPNFYYEGDPREYIPNDIFYSAQYHHSLMQNNLAWDITKGNPNIIVAVTDDGVQLTHPDLVQNIWVNTNEIPNDGIDNDNNGYIDDINGWDFSFTGNNNNPNPNNGVDKHGTHVSGIIGASIDNTAGIAGVAGLSTIMPLQFYETDRGIWTATMIANTFAYAAANGANILNCSYNIDMHIGNPVFIAAMQHLLDNNVLLFISAGNENIANPRRQIYTQGLFVTSTTSTDVRSSFSNYGVGMDVAAPGSLILSTVLNSQYDYASGTSMSSPNAAGVAALIWGQNPTWNVYQVAAQLLGTADDISAQNPTMIGMLGSGRVNSFKALTNTLPAPRVKSLVGLPLGNVHVSNPPTPTSFTISFDQVMDAASVNNPGNIEFRGAGPNNIFNDGDDVLYTFTPEDVYRVGSNSMSYSFDEAISLTCGIYRFTVFSNGVQNPFNTPLDGNRDGVGGDHFIHEFIVGKHHYLDSDGDGYGIITTSIIGLCEYAPIGYASIIGDCDDSNPNVNPGAADLCNNIDEDCDGMIDLDLRVNKFASTDSADIILPGTSTGMNTIEPASIFPSGIIVAGYNGVVKTVEIKINRISHTRFNDLDFVLESPRGTKMLIFSDVTPNGPRGNHVDVSFTISDDGILPPMSVGLVEGEFYRPVNYGELFDLFPLISNNIRYPGPTGSYTLTSSFSGEDPNGVWKLYIVDDRTDEVGKLESWELVLHTNVTSCNTLPTPQVVVTQPECFNNFGDIEIAFPVDPTYTYSIGGAYQSSTVFTNLNSGSYTVTVRDDQGNTSDPVIIIINDGLNKPATPGVIHGPANVCPYSGTSTVLNFYIDTINLATSYTWTWPSTVSYVSGQGTNSLQVRVNANFNTNSDRTIIVVASNICGTSAASSITLFAEQPTTPTVIVASSNDICSSIASNSPITYTISKVPGAASYNWILDMSGVASVVHPNSPGENDTSVVITFTSAFRSRTLQVNAVNNCGVSDYISIDLRFIEIPIPGIISGPTIVCQYAGNGSPLAVYSIPYLSDVVYTWTLPAGITNLIENGNEVSFNYPANYSGGSISVNVSNGCDISPESVLDVSIQSPTTPIAIEVEQLENCPDRVYKYSIAPLVDTTIYIVWTVPSEATIINGAFTNSIIVSYPNTAVAGDVTVQLQGSCGNSALRILNVQILLCGSNPGTGTGLNVNLYPNPSSSSSNLEIESNSLDDVFVRIFDVKGRLISKIKTAPNTIHVLQENLIPGVYMIEVRQGNQKRVKKFLKH